MDEHAEAPQQGRYAVLPPAVRREDLRTSQESRTMAEVRGEHDRETVWLLRTAGL